MRKVLFFLSFCCLAIFPCIKVNAECNLSKEELDGIVINYYRDSGESDEIHVIVYGIPDNVKIVLKDSSGTVVGESNSENTTKDIVEEYKNVFSFIPEYVSGNEPERLYYSYDAYCVDSEVSTDNVLKSGKLVTEKYNKYSELDECYLGSTSEYCETYKDVSNVKSSDIIKSIQDNYSGEPIKDSERRTTIVIEEDPISEVVKQNYTYFVVPALTVSICVVVYIVVIKKKMRKKHE